jgi:transposase
MSWYALILWKEKLTDEFCRYENTLTEIVEEILARCRAEIRKASKGANPCSEPQAGEEKEPTYLTERWNQGERNGQRLFRELQAQGYKGGVGTLYRFLRSLRGYSASSQGRIEQAQNVPETPFQQFSAQKAVWLFVRDPSDLEKTEQEELAAIRQASSTANTVYELVQDFMLMIRHREGERLDAWLENVQNSQIRELQKMVRSIERDKAAVLAGLTLPHSNGVVEGSVNKLKFLKRVGFGRAGFALLRQRVLHAL